MVDKRSRDFWILLGHSAKQASDQEGNVFAALLQSWDPNLDFQAGDQVVAQIPGLRLVAQMSRKLELRV